MTMIWATPAEVRAYVDAQAAAWGRDVWPALPESDDAVVTMIDSAARSLVPKVLRWPVLDDTDRAEDPEQRSHLVEAVGQVIGDRLRTDAKVKELGGQGAADVIASGGRVKAGNLEVQGGGSGSVNWSRSRVPVDAIFALQAAGMLGGSVPTW